MRLLSEKWLPVCFRDGIRSYVSPDQIGDPDIVAFAAERPDFNGALAQFAIGLLQTTTPMDSSIRWREWFAVPPDAAELAKWFAPVEEIFAFDGDGARFMQDYSMAPSEGSSCDIGALFIESPGENALKNNSDHFVKRGRISAVCPHCAALALFTLQVNAPSGGVGHRTGLRGGGPLTTLVLCQPQKSLWHDLWLNVQERTRFLARGQSMHTAPHLSFPWLADIATIQKEGGETTSAQVHSHHVFWAMPRRIRLDMEAIRSGTCDVCGRFSEKLIQRYRTKNYGLNYKGAWNHPLSPYYEAKGEWLPVHPQPGGFAYRHWLAWVMGMESKDKKQRPAQTVDQFKTHRMRSVKGQLRLWAFGYDTDNMKARCWYESSLPLYGLSECDAQAQKRVEQEVGAWLEGANWAVGFLRNAVKDAWFGAETRGDFDFVDVAFWNVTEFVFYRQLKNLIEREREGNLDEAVALSVREAWHAQLRKVCLDMFDGEFVGAGCMENKNPRRVAMAYQTLKRNLNGQKMRKALALPLEETAKTSKKTQ